MKTKRLRALLPFEQGGLDALCGIYSLVNADKIVKGTTDHAELFHLIIHHLASKDKLADTLVNGMLLKDVKAIVAEILENRWEWGIRFAGVGTPNLKDFWKEMHDFLLGGKNRAIIICLSGIHDHWTVVKGITKDRLVLHDSGGLCYLPRKHCTTGRTAGSRHHVLHPAQTFFISEKDEKK